MSSICHQYISSMYVINICRQYMSSTYVINVYHQYMSSIYVINVCHQCVSSIYVGTERFFLIKNLRRVRNVIFFLLGDSPASEFYVRTFRNTLFHIHRRCKSMKTEQSVPKRRQIKFRCWGITQKKEYNIKALAYISGYYYNQHSRLSQLL